MVCINLLPWREELRLQRKQRFFISLGGFAVVVIFFIILIHTQIAYLIAEQKSGNVYLQTEIEKVNQQITQIEALQVQRELFMSRINLIYRLQQEHSVLVYVLEDLVNVVPADVYLTEIKRTGETILLTGKAKSNAQISLLMHQIRQASWLTQPVLLEIKKNEDGSGDIINFSLQCFMHRVIEKNVQHAAN
jgi:type IV pilus assembly protein PilN